MNQSEQQEYGSEDSSPLFKPNPTQNQLTDLQQFVKDNVLSEKIKEDLKPQQLKNFDLTNLLSKSVLSDENKLVIKKGIEFVMKKQQPVFVKYFETLLGRAEEFTEEYYHPERQALASGKVKPQSATPEELQERFNQRYGGGDKILNFELDYDKSTLLQRKLKENVKSEAEEAKEMTNDEVYKKFILPRTRQYVDEIQRMKRSKSSSSASKQGEFCGGCLQKMREKEGFVPILEYILSNQDFHKMMVTLPQGEYPQKKWQLTGGNSFTLRQEKIDFMMNKDYFKNLEGREAQPKFELYQGLQSEKDRSKFMESHPLSVENLIDEDFKRQQKSVYKNYYIRRLFKYTNQDQLYQSIHYKIAEDLIKYFEAVNAQQEINNKLFGFPKNMRVEIEKPSIDPKDLEIQKLKQKLEELRLKSERNTTNYYKELINYRQNIERQQKYQYDQSKIQDDYVIVKYFTEEDFFQLDDSMPSSFGMNEDAQRNKTFSYKNRQSTLVGENDTELKPKEVMLTKNLQNQIIERLNEKLNSQKLQYEQILNKNQIYLQKLIKKLQVFEGLPQNLSGLATLPVSDFYKYAANLEQNPEKIWEMIDESFNTCNFFESVVHTKYGHLFQDDSEDKFRKNMDEIRARVNQKLALASVENARELDHFKTLSHQYQQQLRDLTSSYDIQKQTAIKDAEERVKMIMLQKNHAQVQQFTKEIEGLRQQIEMLKETDTKNDKSYMDLKLKNFFYRLRVQTQLKKLSGIQNGEDFEKIISKNEEFAKSYALVKEIVTQDVDAQVMQLTSKISQNLKVTLEKLSTTQIELVEFRWEKINLERQLSSKNHDSDQFKALFQQSQSQLHSLQESSHQDLQKFGIEQEENQNVKKLIDKVLLKNKTLEDKLKSLGGKMPKNELDRRIFFQENDKAIIESVMIHDIHEVIRKQFLATQVEEGGKGKKGSFEYLISELKRYLNSQSEESSRRQRKTFDQQCQTSMMDVKKDLIFFRNNQSSDGEILAHTGSQTKATKEFNEFQVQTDLSQEDLDKQQADLEILQSDHQNLQEKLNKTKDDLQDTEKRLDTNEFEILNLKKDKKDLQKEIKILNARKDVIVSGKDDACNECESSISNVSEKTPIKVITTKTATKWGAARQAFLSKNKGESLNGKSPQKNVDESIDNPTQIQSAKYEDSINKSKERSSSIKKINSRFQEKGPLDLIVKGEGHGGDNTKHQISMKSNKMKSFVQKIIKDPTLKKKAKALSRKRSDSNKTPDPKSINQLSNQESLQNIKPVLVQKPKTKKVHVCKHKNAGTDNDVYQKDKINSQVNSSGLMEQVQIQHGLLNFDESTGIRLQTPMIQSDAINQDELRASITVKNETPSSNNIIKEFDFNGQTGFDQETEITDNEINIKKCQEFSRNKNLFSRLDAQQAAHQHSFEQLSQNLKEQENLKWQQKLEGNNTSSRKELSGMKMYHDEKSGQTFVHLNDIKSALSSKLYQAQAIMQQKKKQTERNAINHYLSSGNLQAQSQGFALNKHRNSSGAQYLSSSQMNKSHSVNKILPKYTRIEQVNANDLIGAQPYSSEFSGSTLGLPRNSDHPLLKLSASNPHLSGNQTLSSDLIQNHDNSSNVFFQQKLSYQPLISLNQNRPSLQPYQQYEETFNPIQIRNQNIVNKELHNYDLLDSQRHLKGRSLKSISKNLQSVQQRLTQGRNSSQIKVMGSQQESDLQRQMRQLKSQLNYL